MDKRFRLLLPLWDSGSFFLFTICLEYDILTYAEI